MEIKYEVYEESGKIMLRVSDGTHKCEACVGPYIAGAGTLEEITLQIASQLDEDHASVKSGCESKIWEYKTENGL